MIAGMIRGMIAVGSAGRQAGVLEHGQLAQERIEVLQLGARPLEADAQPGRATDGELHAAALSASWSRTSGTIDAGNPRSRQYRTAITA